jgi:hypothetical protein
MFQSFQLQISFFSDIKPEFSAVCLILLLSNKIIVDKGFNCFETAAGLILRAVAISFPVDPFLRRMNSMIL